jgi:hypothetical protein
MAERSEWDPAWLGTIRTLPNVLGPEHLPKLNEGLRYLFEELGPAWLGTIRTLPNVLGPEHLPKLNEGLRYLFEELGQAQAEFRAGNHLNGAYLSLLAVKFFLALFRTTGVEGLAMPLLALESALWALDEGITEPLLRPARRAKSGRPRASPLRQEFIGMVAYTVRRLRDFGHSTSEAYTMVASDLDHIGVKGDRGSDRISQRTVRYWCEKVSEDVGRREAAAKGYAALLIDPSSITFDRMKPEAATELIRQRLINAAEGLGIASPPRKPVNPSC